MNATRIRVVSRIGEIDRTVWDAIATPAKSGMVPGGGPTEGGVAVPAHDPFVSHDFLKSLEDSASVAAGTGWMPHHLVLEDNTGAAVALAPCYLKGHSFGEYVFDHGWAEAFERAGGRYYPKLLVGIPFTPVSGRRLMVRPDAQEQAETHRRVLADALAGFAVRHGLSSAHVNFLPEEEWKLLGEHGYLLRTDRQFHWENAGYRDFEDFLGALTARKRKMVRRERREALAGGLAIERVTGADISESHWDDFFAFYMDTGRRKWGRPYLNRHFFSLIGERMADDILLVFARRNGRRIAGALNFIGSDTLYGRYWGCVEHHPFLHFEICYHQAIEFAIEAGLKRVEAGAQGDHKIARGYLPRRTCSAHFIVDERLRAAVADFLAHERRHVTLETRLLGEYAPFRRDLTLDPPGGA